jgi:hypothetical protein
MAAPRPRRPCKRNGHPSYPLRGPIEGGTGKLTSETVEDQTEVISSTSVAKARGVTRSDDTYASAIPAPRPAVRTVGSDLSAAQEMRIEIGYVACAGRWGG